MNNQIGGRIFSYNMLCVLTVFALAGCDKKTQRPDADVDEQVQTAERAQASEEDAGQKNGEEKSIENESGTHAGIAEISLKRGPCFGTCPVYSVNVASDGVVQFDGEQHVAQVGEAKRQISADDFERLARAVDEAGYFELSDEDLASGVRATDMSTLTFTVRRDGEDKTVEFYEGFIEAPANKKLRELARQIDNVAGTDEWVNAEQADATE